MGVSLPPPNPLSPSLPPTLSVSCACVFSPALCVFPCVCVFLCATSNVQISSTRAIYLAPARDKTKVVSRTVASWSSMAVVDANMGELGTGDSVVKLRVCIARHSMPHIIEITAYLLRSECATSLCCLAPCPPTLPICSGVNWSALLAKNDLPISKVSSPP